MEIDLWWRTYRDKAPDLFAEELSEALDLIASSPHVGRARARIAVPGVRRVLLRSTRYHVYYSATDTEVTVLAVWSSVRGHGPDLNRA